MYTKLVLRLPCLTKNSGHRNYPAIDGIGSDLVSVGMRESRIVTSPRALKF